MGGFTKKEQKKKRKIGPIILMLCSFAVIFGTTYTLGKYWVEIYSKYQEKEDLALELEDLQKKEKELSADVDRLQDDEYIARYAREKYYYSKDGEYILKIPDEDEN